MARIRAGSPKPRVMTVVRSSRPTASGSSTAATARAMTCLQVYINNTEGTAERALTSNEFVNWGPYWHPDDRHIIYATSKHGHSNYELYLMDVDSGKEERITYHEGFDGLPVFSPDGKRLMWTSSGRTADKKSQLFIADFSLDSTPHASEAAASQ